MGNNYYYDDDDNTSTSEAVRKRQRYMAEKRRRKEALRRKRLRIWRIKMTCLFVSAGVIAGLSIFGIIRLVGHAQNRKNAASGSNVSADDPNDPRNSKAPESGVLSTEAGTEEGEYIISQNTEFTEDENTVHLSSVHRSDEAAETGTTQTSSEADSGSEPTQENYSFDQAFIDSSKAGGFSGADKDYVASEYAILVDADTGKILLDRDAFTKMYPASMTKVLTLLVAVEALKDENSLNDTVNITQEIVDKTFLSGSSSMYYVPGDKPTVKELLYGTILPSGADAAFALADYTAGSEEAFVAMMNDKLQELGLSDTAHFTNPVGIYDDDHYCTAYDMAVIMKAAMDNDICKEVLGAHTYTAAPSIEYPNPGDHIVSNWFLRRIEDKYDKGTVIGAKTGYVSESGNCAVSEQVANDGKRYICVTADTWGSWRAIFDHVAIYSQFTN